MAPKEQANTSDGTSEHGREAFIQEAVMNAQRTWDLEQKMASMQVREGHLKG